MRPAAIPPPQVLDAFIAIVGAGNAISDPEAMTPFLVEWRDRYRGRAALVLKPGSAEEVSRILTLADETGTPIVPQGGNTGLVGGQIPFETGHELVVALGRLNRIREVDAEGDCMVVEAGVVLQAAQDAAARADRLFPLSLASEGSCQIGGVLATNAGGAGVLAYGSARDLVLGLEVVTADGRVWNGLRKLHKDNTGYDLRDLFIGSEGTLGIITAAVLRLFPAPAERATAFVGLADLDQALALFNLARRHARCALTAFEFMPRIGLDFVLRHGHGARDPLGSPSPWYALIELSGALADGSAGRALEALLGEALARGAIRDGAIAGSLAQTQALWRLRELMSEVQKAEGGSIKHDVSVPVSRLPAFIAEADRRIASLLPGARPVAFGHFGDGNVHYNISQPLGADRTAFLARWEEINAAVHAIVQHFGGSISAEHGVGRMKRDLLPTVKDAIEMELMRRIKRALDPKNILNPGKLLAD